MVKFIRNIRKQFGNFENFYLFSKWNVKTTNVLSSCFLSLHEISDTGTKLNMYNYLSSKIKACGPITVAEYMKECLLHPTAGYYMTRDVFGEKGDFITNPEITQLFGEMTAVWIINEYLKITNLPFQLIELGPGRGTLMKDILRVFKKLNLLDKLSVHLVEVSPALSEIQAKNLCVSIENTDLKTNKLEDGLIGPYRKGLTDSNVEICWYYSINDIPKHFSVFIAHEFFDALPIHKFQKTKQGWNEILIDIDWESNDKKLRYVTSQQPTLASQIYIPKNEKRDQIEISPQTMVIIDYMSTFLVENGGIALIADYGHNGEKGDTFRAFCKHQQQHPLLNPGSADLTADVDFSLIKRIAEKDDRLIVFGPVNQSDFLESLGINIRLERLLSGATNEQKKLLKSGYHMIMDKNKMGNCFKLISLYPSVLRDRLQQWPVIGFQIPNTKT